MFERHHHHHRIYSYFIKKINTFRKVFKFIDYVLGNLLEIKSFQIFSIINPWSHVPGLSEEYQSMQCTLSA